MTTLAVGSVPAVAAADPGSGGSSDRSNLALSWAELAEYARDAARSGGCTRPVRLKGHLDAIDLATGERRAMYDTATEPGGVLLMPCGNRREAICPACSQVYKQDARQLVRAGLTGGKGIPETVAAPAPSTASASAAPTASATPGDARWTTRWSWSSRPGHTTAPATPPPQAPSWPSPRRLVPATSNYPQEPPD
jgi:hypothetical protein